MGRHQAAVKETGEEDEAVLYLVLEEILAATGKETRCQQSKTAYQLLAYGLKNELGIEKIPDIAKNQYGKPYFPDYPHIHFNVSHCQNGIMCGIHEKEIGVDIEKLLVYKENLAKRISHEREWKLMCEAPDEEKSRILGRIWVAKESYLKQQGTGINRDLRSLDFSGCIQDVFFQYGCRFQIWQMEECSAAVCSEQEIRGIRVLKTSDLKND